MDSFEQLSVDRPLMVSHNVSIAEGVNVQPTLESAVQFEVTESEIRPIAAAAPEVVVVSDNDAVTSRNTMQNDCRTSYSTEQAQMYFSL